MGIRSLPWTSRTDRVRRAVIASLASVAAQRKCPDRLVGHVGIATTDAGAFALVVDALEHRGRVNPARAPNSVCRGPSYIRGGLLGGLLSAWRFSMWKGLPRWHVAWREPTLRPYARHP
jgi:hypothetical protein